jgi:hypothetical protein
LKPPSEKANTDSEGFELHVKNHPSEADQKCLKAIVQTRNLSIEEIPNVRLLIESIRRTAEYASDISEVVLNLNVESVLT